LLEAEAPEAEAKALRVEAEVEALKILALPHHWVKKFWSLVVFF
jgi:hypothetical protein